MSVHLTQQLCASRTDDTLHRAADELSEAAPNLLHWYTQAHKALRGCYKTSPLLFLPMTHQGNAPLNPSDFTDTLVVAGVMATLLKAVFETAPRNLCAIRERNPERSLGADLNQLVANISLARLTAGGHYPAENHHDLRLGQTIALHILRDALAQDNRTASVSFQDFDGHDVTLQCHARSFGRGRVDFSENGRLSDWPKQDAARRTHLTAVV
jgi:sulfur transfer protein SufE